MNFDEILRNEAVLDGLYDMHFDKCTPIQELAIPLITQGRDLIGIAQTGTGKTAAYLLPVIDIMAEEGYPEDAINCLVLAPTRELARQIDQQMEGFAYFMPVSSLAIYGGTDGYTYEQQRQGLKKGADVVIATPGRLLAHLSMGYVDLSQVSFLILDEADRMLDMGFYDDIMQIVSHLPKNRQTLLFSATMPPKIKQLAKQILVDPAEVKLAVSKPADKIQQAAVVCYETQKLPTLLKILKENKGERIVIFSSSKIKVRQLGDALRKAFPADKASIATMHSDLEQADRDRVMLDFRSGKVKILAATDIIARGIDVDDISMVINFDMPREAEDYVHRVGRTARADADGRAITFVTDREIRKFKAIEKFIGKTVEKIEVDPSLGDTPDYNAAKGERKASSSKSSGNKKRRKPADKPKRDANPESNDVKQTEAAKAAKKRPHRHKRLKKNTSSNDNKGGEN